MRNPWGESPPESSNRCSICTSVPIARENFENIRSHFESDDRSEVFLDFTEMETQMHKPANHEADATVQVMKSVEGPILVSEEGALAQREKPRIDTLPQELLDIILKDLDRVTMACLGLTCRKLYSVHFARNGPVSLSEKSRHRPAGNYSLEAQIRTMENIVERWLGRKYEWCYKYLIFVPKAKAWAYSNWLPEEYGGEEHKKVSRRKKKLQRLKDKEDIRIKREELEDWQRQRIEREREVLLEKHRRKGTLNEFLRMEELIEHASKLRETQE